MLQEITTARVGGAHGIAGEVLLVPFSGEVGHLLVLSELTLVRGGSRRRYAVESMRPSAKGVICKLESVDDRNVAAALAGSEVVVPRDQAAVLGTNEYYIADLIGCRLVFEGQTLAEVKAVWDNGQTDMLDVVLTDGGLRTVPLRDEFVGAINVNEGFIELRVDWILE